MKENEIKLATEVERMTSLEIADVTGKPHNDVLKAIRKMEDGWKEVAQGNFSLSRSWGDSPCCLSCPSCLSCRQTTFLF